MKAREQHRRQTALLDWYDTHGRDLPWRLKNGVRPDPYRVWLSEIMLQQTTVATVGPYFRDFTARWPTVEALAAADLDSVLHAWQGLGYYARARNLHKCAGVVASEHRGRFPDDEPGLLKLPGIGPYTAAAIAAIAFNLRCAPVDGNIERVISRLMCIEAPPPGLRSLVADALAPLIPEGRPGDFVQAMMDLGASLCSPRAPQCPACPWAGMCGAMAAQKTGDLPKRPVKKPKPHRQGIAFWIENTDGAVLLRRRPEKGLLGGMMEFPSTDWREADWPLEEAFASAPVTTKWTALPGVVSHTFTHFHLHLTVVAANGCPVKQASAIWSLPDRLGDHALPTVMKKIARHVDKCRT